VARTSAARPAGPHPVGELSSLQDDSLQAWITYEIAFEDTDGDGGLDENDAASLYVSDLHGGSFRRVLPKAGAS